MLTVPTIQGGSRDHDALRAFHLVLRLARSLLHLSLAAFRAARRVSLGPLPAGKQPNRAQTWHSAAPTAKSEFRSWGGAWRIRTADPLPARQVLSR